MDGLCNVRDLKNATYIVEKTVSCLARLLIESRFESPTAEAGAI